MKIILAKPRGFCAGVELAISIVDRALCIYGSPIYIRHEVVHNRFVVDNFKKRGAVFVEELREIPEHSIVIFSAHGVSQAVREEAKARKLKVLDATCPLVSKVHKQVGRASAKGDDVILIGHAGHTEVEGTLGQYLNSAGNIFLVEEITDIEKVLPKLNHKKNIHQVSQTTLAIDETAKIINNLKLHLPNLKTPRKQDICYATQNRQDAVRQLAKNVDMILVVGSKNSSNSNRLKELATQLGVTAYLIDDPDEIKSAWFTNCKILGVTAGASAPDELVDNIIAHVQTIKPAEIVEMEGIDEKMSFALPRELQI